MDKLSMCRICLVENVKMYSLISANLQELYERLTKIPFVTQDKKPVQVCYLCRARLQNCHRLQVACLKSEEFLNKVIADSELNETELQDLNTLRTVHPLTIISYESSIRKDPEDDKIDEDNDFKFDPLETTSDVQVKCEFFEDDSFANEEAFIKSEVTVEEEDITIEDGDMSDNSHTIQNTELKHDIHIKTDEVVLERIDLEQFKIGEFAAKESKPDLLKGNSESITERSAVVKNKIIVEPMHTIEKPMSKVCEKSSRKNQLVEHTRTHTGAKKTHVCVICDKSFSNKNGLQKHSRIHSGKKPYSCEICEKSFTVKSTLVSHTRIHTGERPYRCNICDHSFIQKTNLVNHIRTHTGEKPYRCNICEQSFSQKDGLAYHTLKHTGERPYKCNICEQSFTRKKVLVGHTRIHTGERPYKCNLCEQSFTQKSHLVIHTRTHTGERPYRCNICQKSFIGASNLVRHTRKHNPKNVNVKYAE